MRYENIFQSDTCIGRGNSCWGHRGSQAKPPIYLIAEVDISNQDAYMNDFVPKFRTALKNSKIIAVSAKATPVEGDAPKGRVVIQVWDSLAQLEAFQNSADAKAARVIGDKYAKFRTFVVDGVVQ
jgi:uncharacterized protein (DUF1330 family)